MSKILNKETQKLFLAAGIHVVHGVHRPLKGEVPEILQIAKPHCLYFAGFIDDIEQTKQDIALIKQAYGDDKRWHILDCESKFVNRTKGKPGFEGILEYTAPEMASHGVEFVRREARKLGDILAYVGINMVFAPCFDLDLGSSIISKYGRSYSPNPEVAYIMATAFAEELEKLGIRTVAKHFPGHGSANGDSHLGTVYADPTSFDAELQPFKKSLNKGMIKSYMLGHVIYPSLGSDLPASVCPKVFDLFSKCGSKGDEVLFSDSIFMGAVTNMGLNEYVSRFFKYSGDIIIFDKPDSQYVQKTFGLSLLEAYEVIAKAVEQEKTNRQRIENVINLGNYIEV